MVDQIVFIIPPEIAIGYEILGITVFRETNPQKAAKLIETLSNDQTVGLIGIPDHFYEAIDPEFLKRLEKQSKPVLIRIPFIRRLQEPVEPLAYVQEAIRRATGYYMKLDLEGTK